MCNSFAAILEASLQCEDVWESFRSGRQCSSLFRSLLMAHPLLDVRQGIADSVRGICCTLSTWVNNSIITCKPSKSSIRSSSPPSRNFALYFWETLVNLIPESVNHCETAQQFFDISLFVFRSIDEISRDELDFNGYIKVWSDLLLRHQPDEVSCSVVLTHSALTLRSS